VTPLSLTILTTSFPARRRGVIVGTWAGIAGLAAAGGPLVGGAFIQGLSWHWIFWVNVPIGLLAAAASVVRLTETRGPATRLDLPGVGLVSIGAVGLAWGLVRATDAGWGSTEVVAALGLGILALASFAVWETRTPQPMLPPGLFRIPSFAGAITTAFLLIGASTSAAFLVAQYFQFALGYSPLGAGLRFLPWTAAPLFIAPVAGMLCDRIGPRPLMVAGMLLQGVGLAWIALIASTTVHYPHLVPALIIAGVGLSLALPTTAAASLGAVRPPDMGKASGVNNMLQRFGGVFGVAVVSAVFAANGHLGTPAGVTTGFRPALAVSAGLSLAGAASALLVSRNRRRTPIAATQKTPEMVRGGA
jgi:MFS family permease